MKTWIYWIDTKIIDSLKPQNWAGQNKTLVKISELQIKKAFINQGFFSNVVLILSN